MAASRQGSCQGNSQVTLNAPPEIILTAAQHTPPPMPGVGQGGIPATSLPQLSIQDLRAVATDIKDTISAAIAELHLNMRALNDRVITAERVLEDHDLVHSMIHMEN